MLFIRKKNGEGYLLLQAPWASKKARKSSLTFLKRGVMQELGESGFDLGEVEVEKRTWRDDPCDFQADAPALVELLDFKTPLRSLFSKTWGSLHHFQRSGSVPEGDQSIDLWRNLHPPCYCSWVQQRWWRKPRIRTQISPVRQISR